MNRGMGTGKVARSSGLVGNLVRALEYDFGSDSATKIVDRPNCLIPFIF